MTLRSLISLAASAALALLSTELAAQINGGDCGTWVEIPGKALLPSGVAEDRPVRARRFADGSLALRSPLTVLADGGARSGLDVVRLLALGARGVLLGRAWAYALAAGGQAGVAKMLQLIEAEMRVAMALTGVTRIADIDRTNLAEGN